MNNHEGVIICAKRELNFEIPQKPVLEELYLKREMPMHRVAIELNMSVGKVFNLIKKYNIPVRKSPLKGRKLSKEQSERISKLHKGKKLSEETKRKIAEGHKKGGIGHRKERSDGYVSIYFPDHPKSSSDGYVMEHILVMESLLGRHLADDECVHHINAVRNDNRKENLKLMTKSEHISYHVKERAKRKGK